MQDKEFQIGAEGIDIEKIMGKIRANIEEKKKAGVYEKYDLSGISRLEVENISTEEEFLNYYIEILQRTCDVNIGDFEIINEGGILGSFEVLAKKVVWKLLKFYTYRLFSQQKEFNCQVTNAFLSLRKHMDTRFKEIHERLDFLTKDRRQNPEVRIQNSE
ncbi:MAG: hypothetical protein HYS08_10350 [Chlamydiae bacterium]|nr:hypothetical protein [Chlamydiota bacterium]MBI3266526.1 hypothetical protein [Chlamydiota bacterium]